MCGMHALQTLSYFKSRLGDQHSSASTQDILAIIQQGALQFRRDRLKVCCFFFMYSCLHRCSDIILFSYILRLHSVTCVEVSRAQVPVRGGDTAGRVLRALRVVHYLPPVWTEFQQLACTDICRLISVQCTACIMLGWSTLMQHSGTFVHLVMLTLLCSVPLVCYWLILLLELHDKQMTDDLEIITTS